MLSIELEGQDEYLWKGENPSPTTFPSEKSFFPLYHQWLTYNAETPIIVNTYNTGTGKTRAALLRLLKRARAIGFDNIMPNKDNALLIAPTNELLKQHVKDAEEFCLQNELPYRVLAITKADLEEYKDLPDFSEEQLRRGAVLRSILRDPSKVDNDTSKGATLFVVNPDIFYYAHYFCYQRFDRVSLFQEFFRRFNYIMIDEFHYYDPKQFAFFLFFIKLSQHYKLIDSSAKKRQFCILTATPHPQVTEYLKQLEPEIPITWIDPRAVVPSAVEHLEPVRALTPLRLQLYSTEEMQEREQSGGLQQLALKQRADIRKWLDEGQDGAIISSALGTINRLHKDLSEVISPTTEMGRITGAEQSEGRSKASLRQLILATPTVDIGYNFDRSKPRQNIDFLLLDAYSSDEFLQRIGRAGRVLSKEQRDRYSTVLAVIDTAFYTALRQYDGQALSRATLRRLAEDTLPTRNSLYAYVKSGAIAEAFRPVHFLGQQTSTSDLPELEAFFQEIQRLFALTEEKSTEKKANFTYKQAQRAIYAFEDRERRYAKLRAIPNEAFETYRLILDRRLPNDTSSLTPDIAACLEIFMERLKDAKAPGASVGRNGREVVQWLRHDLCSYAIDKARFSFRDSFQPPLALVFDPDHLHSSRDTALYNALHIIRYYDARYYDSLAKWEKETEKTAPAEAKNALVYCRLIQHKDDPLQIGLKLNATEYLQREWEEHFAYQVTALYGMEIVVRNDHRGLGRGLQSLLSNQFVPAFAALNTTTSRTAGELRKLQRRARFFPMQLHVTFCDGKSFDYLVVLGTMAFQVYAEIPRWVTAKDRNKTLLEDDNPYIC